MRDVDSSVFYYFRTFQSSLPDFFPISSLAITQNLIYDILFTLLKDEVIRVHQTMVSIDVTYLDREATNVDMTHHFFLPGLCVNVWHDYRTFNNCK